MQETTPNEGEGGPAALTFDEYQRRASAYAVYPPEAGIAYSVLGLIDEVGELAMKVLVRLMAGPRPKDSRLFDELAAVLDGAARYGEIAGARKKKIRDGGELSDGDREVAAALAAACSGDAAKPLRKECGDVQWYLSDVARQLSSSLGELAEGNLAKLDDRAKRGVISGSGDNR